MKFGIVTSVRLFLSITIGAKGVVLTIVADSLTDKLVTPINDVESENLYDT
ncbi:hypothetical protein [Clostridium sp. DSM 8431]|uniref:hypothetical protein n=1 Tax=Clostridium sp. DSM 8431 TaxID=1761781 RepID=UPI001587B584|nr:hypothetical protein [Clostridium sp. DSM 8431]